MLEQDMLKMEIKTYHLQSPYSADPNLNRAFDPIYVVQFDPLPPAPPGGLSPEKKELLSHADRIVIGQVAFDIGSKFGQCQTTDDGLARLGRPMAPPVIAIESAANSQHGFPAKGESAK